MRLRAASFCVLLSWRSCPKKLLAAARACLRCSSVAARFAGCLAVPLWSRARLQLSPAIGHWLRERCAPAPPVKMAARWLVWKRFRT